MATNDDEQSMLRDRSPRPYLLHDGSIAQYSDKHAPPDSSTNLASPGENGAITSITRSSSPRPEPDGSESGTEADDERPRYLALPPAPLRLRKGLKHSDGTASPLLTPSQLDQQGQRFNRAQLDGTRKSRRFLRGDEDDLEKERKQFEARILAERIRRLCEAALLGFIGVSVVLGSTLWRLTWQWYLLVVLSQIAAIAGLIGFYPLRLVSVEHDRGHVHIWSRFQVPPSFDPATVLYPTFLPVLVSLCLVQTLPQLFLPSTILGLASLPPRLFPAWARTEQINVLHWMVSTVPLILARGAGFLARRFPAYLSTLATPDMPGAVPPEWLLLLFPLHQALLPNIHYLTTSSLLPTEKHLLSTALINVLLFASSPQVSILRAVLWLGGVCCLVSLTHILSWNVTLARVPTWRLRDFRISKNGDLLPQIKDEFVAALRHMGLAGSRSSESSDSEDEKVAQLRRTKAKKSGLVSAATFHQDLISTSQVVESDGADSVAKTRASRSGSIPSNPQRRRNTIATPTRPAFEEKPTATKRRASRKRDWVAKLSPLKVTLRKRFYAIYAYLALVLIVLLPVRTWVSHDALADAEPILWAVDYLFGSLPTLSNTRIYLLTTPVSTTISTLTTQLAASPSILSLRHALEPSNTRLLLIAYYALVLLLGLTAVLILSPTIEVDTRRKIFHAIMVTMFLPTIFIDPLFCHLALGLVLAIFLALEVLRAGQIPPLGTAIAAFVAPYVDGRDLRGPMVVSHVFLLIGCAIPFWLSCAAFERDASRWEIVGGRREVAMLAGVVCVGMGDAAASLVGRRYGRHKWPWIGGKSLEGSAAFAFAVATGLAVGKIWLRLGGWEDVNSLAHVGLSTEMVVVATKTLIAGGGASFMEAVLTGANDNVVVPVALWLLCRGLRV